MLLFAIFWTSCKITQGSAMDASFPHILFLEAHASQYLGLSACLSVCFSQLHSCHVMSPVVVRRSQTTSENSNEFLVKFYPIFWCGSSLCDKIWQFYQTTLKMRMTPKFTILQTINIILRTVTSPKIRIYPCASTTTFVVLVFR